ncbi:uncharacterized protein VP01_2868g5 [Puccinia sorghi]|uniref:DUF4219 domain-containing protein n=1 Tax=Puccinia sorghi TaxID=27349 RepID=A0A0L6V1X0_9BASI|nr:uncharacterized protein VP01_2868g5 [Puccinia sorghi]
MSETKETTHIRLTSDNYLFWRFQMKAKRFRCDTWDIVNGVTVKPEKAEEQSDWTKKNQSGYVEVIVHLDADNMVFVGGAVPETRNFNGRYFWNLIRSKYAADDDVAKIAANEDQILEPAALLMSLTLDQFNCPHCRKSFKICGHCQKTVISSAVTDFGSSSGLALLGGPIIARAKV